jgi:hypothetical protein
LKITTKETNLKKYFYLNFKRIYRIQNLVIASVILLLLKYFLFDTELGLELVDQLYEYAMTYGAFAIDFVKKYNYIEDSNVETNLN